MKSGSLVFFSCWVKSWIFVICKGGVGWNNTNYTIIVIHNNKDGEIIQHASDLLSFLTFGELLPRNIQWRRRLKSGSDISALVVLLQSTRSCTSGMLLAIRRCRSNEWKWMQCFMDKNKWKHDWFDSRLKKINLIYQFLHIFFFRWRIHQCRRIRI